MIFWSTWKVNFIIHPTKLISVSLLEARLSEFEVLYYNKLHIVKLSLLFKDTVDLQGQIFWNFFFLCFFFHGKRSIAITTIISEKRFEKYRKERELFTKTNFRKKCVF